MKLRVPLAVALLVAGLCAGIGSVRAQGLVITDHGRSDYRIVVPRDAAPSVSYAGQELQHWLEEMTGVQLSIVSDAQPPAGHEIILGENTRLKGLGVEVDLAALGNEGYVLKTVGPHLVIVGGKLRGTLYGVYGLLEDHLGCRWFTPQVSRIPRVSRLVVPSLNETKVPVLEYREPFVKDCFDGDWCARNRVNSSAASLQEKHGGKVTYCGFVHTFNDLVPPSKYYAEHPEYFSLIGGQRMNGYYQLCLTNPDVLRITIEEIRRRMREHPEATVFSVSQNDTGGACECDECRAVVEREGSQSGPLIEFVNKVADAVRDEFPDKIIDTLAYTYTRKAPRNVRPAPNVVVRLCSIECCFSHPLATCNSAENESFRRDIADWARVCDRLWVWDYTTSFANYLVPFPNRHVLRDNIRFFIENHVTGIFEEDNYTSLSGELSPLDGYLQAKFLWNPDYDENQAMNEFLEGVYGAAGPIIRRYIDLLRDKVVNENIHMHIWEGPHAAYLTEDILSASDRIWDEAEAAVADQPEVLQRVQIARLSLDWTTLSRTTTPTTGVYEVRDGQYDAEVDPVYRRRVERFTRAVEAGGLTALNEGGYPPATFIANTIQRIGPHRVVSMESSGLQVDVVPALGGRIVTLRCGADGPNLLNRGQPGDTGYPATGGYAESWQGSFQGPGWATPYEASPVQETDDTNTLVLSTNLAEGVRLSRTIMLPVNRDYMVIQSTVSNQRADMQPGDLRAAFTFDLGPTDEVTAVLPAMGDQGVISLSMPATQADRQLSFTGAQIAQGITLANHALGRGITVMPTAEAFERVWLRVDARRSTVVFEVKTRASLAPGASTTLTQWVQPLRDVSAVPRAAHVGVTQHQALTVVAQDDQIGLGRYGEWCWIEEDPKAEDGFAVHLNNNHIEWCVQWRYSAQQFEPGRKYEVWARIRLDKRGDAGQAFWAGVYDTVGRVGLGSIAPAMRDIPDSEYHMYHLGTVVPADGHYVWVGPQANLENAAAVYLDYFEMRAVEE